MSTRALDTRPDARTPRRLVLSLACLATVGVLTPAAAPAQAPADAKAAAGEGLKLLSDGDTAADTGKTIEAVILYKRAFEKLLPGMRKVPFKTEVKRDVTAREAMKEVVSKDIDEDTSPEEFRASELGMKALGFLPPDFKLKETMVRVLSEEIAAFYDPKTKTMHLIKEPEAKTKEKPSFLERLMGKKEGFDKDENKTVIAHELTHALADQNFDIEALQKVLRHKQEDDRDLALSALIEGEATLTMIGAQMNDWDGSTVCKIPAANLDRVFSLMIPFMPMFGGKSLRSAPPILSESMIFPYLRGMVFCARLTNDGGWEALNDAYKNPPRSTEQVLHPEKYRAEPDPPTAVDLGALEPGPNWTERGRNVVGEMQLSVLLRRHGGKNAAAGWDGDRYAVFEGPDGKLGLVWFTTWDTENDAREFLRGYAGFQTTKLGDGAKTPDEIPQKLCRTHRTAGTAFAVERRGSDVVVVEGFAPEVTARLVESAFKARKSEVK